MVQYTACFWSIVEEKQSSPAPADGDHAGPSGSMAALAPPATARVSDGIQVSYPILPAAFTIVTEPLSRPPCSLGYTQNSREFSIFLLHLQLNVQESMDLQCDGRSAH